MVYRKIKQCSCWEGTAILHFGKMKKEGSRLEILQRQDRTASRLRRRQIFSCLAIFTGNARREKNERRCGMSEKQGKEYAERLKSEAKEFIDGIGTESEYDQRIIKLIYGFARRGFRESRASRGV